MKVEVEIVDSFIEESKEDIEEIANLYTSKDIKRALSLILQIGCFRQIKNNIEILKEMKKER